MARSPQDRSRMHETGFTVVELLVYLVLTVVVITSAYQLLIGQTRLWHKQHALEDVRSSLRAGANLLAFEFRQASPMHGDLPFISSDSFRVRSLRGSGVVCGKHPLQPRLGLAWTAGDFEPTANDSAMVYVSGSIWVEGSLDQVWEGGDGVTMCEYDGGAPDVVAGVSMTGTPPDKLDGDVTITPRGEVVPGTTVQFTASHPDLSCSDFDSRARLTINGQGKIFDGSMTGCVFNVEIPNDAENLKIDITLDKNGYSQFNNDVKSKSEWKKIGQNSGGAFIDKVRVGAPFRAYRSVQYGIYEEDGRWWVGRRLGGGSYERLTGPLRPPADSGLVFRYFDARGNPTMVPSRVRTVEILLRGESLRAARRGGGLAPAPQQDSLRVRAALRG